MAKSQHKKIAITLLLCVVLATCIALAACGVIVITPSNTQYALKYSRGAIDAAGTIPATVKYDKGAEVTLAAANIFTRNNYEFVCWSDGSSNYDAEATFTMPQKDVTMTAIWKQKTDEDDPCRDGHNFVDGVCTRCDEPDPNYVPTPTTYAVIYKAGATSATGNPPATVNYAAGATVTVVANTFNYSGNDFMGWSDGSKTYQADDTFIMPTKPVTLTAIWQPTDPCANGHNFEDGVCTECGAPDPNYVPTPSNNSMLHAVGTKVVDADGNEVYLRGTNVGGYLVTENWMNAFEGAEDYYSIKQTLISRFGVNQANALWQTYRENWWTDLDFEICADMGMNVLRLPFTYMDVDPAAVTSLASGGQNYDFSILDDFVTRAASHGLYVILDLHGAYGSHNGQDHSGQIFGEGQVDFYSNETKISLTVKLWKALAQHFKDNVTVAGYDILNEPGENGGWIDDTVGNAPHWDVFDRIYKAIRTVDVNHMVIFESSWGANNLPMPDVYGWTNCMYSFHHYNSKSNFDEFKQDYDIKFAELTGKNFGVPLQMGEFTGYSVESQWRYAFQLLNDNNFHWCSWSFKAHSNGSSSWGIINKKYSSKVNVQTDSYDVIAQKFAANRTAATGEYYKFSSGTTLRSLFEDALGKVNLNATISNVTVTEQGGKAYLAINGTYNNAVSAADALTALQEVFYADWQNNADAGGASSSWGKATVYVLGESASISASTGTYQILLDISAVQKGYVVFFHFGNSSTNLVCANVSGEVTAGGKTYSASIYTGWHSNLVSVTVS